MFIQRNFIIQKESKNYGNAKFKQACMNPVEGKSKKQAKVLSDEFYSKAKKLGIVLENIGEKVGYSAKSLVRAIQITKGMYRSSLQISKGEPADATYREMFANLGGLYSKIGMLVPSPGITVEDLREYETSLQKGQPVNFNEIMSIIESDLGRPVESTFSDISVQPIASGSVAQIHSARLRTNGKEVVVKVLKPRVRETMLLDVDFFKLVAKFLRSIYPPSQQLSLAELAGSLVAHVHAETDLRREAAAMQTFAAFLEKSDLQELATCPFVYKQLCGQRVLVQERLHGVSILDVARVRGEYQRDPAEYLRRAAAVAAAHAVAQGIFHGDLHAGNLMALRDGRVGFIDFGVTGHVSTVTWKGLRVLYVSYKNRDFDTLARALVTVGLCKERKSGSSFEDLAADLRQLIESMESGAAPGVVWDFYRARALLEDFLERYSVKVPVEFFMLYKQCVLLASYLATLDPEAAAGLAS